MPCTTALMPAQVPIKFGADMIKLMKNRNEFIFEGLILESGQTKSHQVIDFPTVYIILLDLVISIPTLALKIATFKSHGSNPGLQPMKSEIPSPGDCYQNFIGIKIKKFGAVLRYV